jgi:hypothetical protein
LTDRAFEFLPISEEIPFWNGDFCRYRKKSIRSMVGQNFADIGKTPRLNCQPGGCFKY